MVLFSKANAKYSSDSDDYDSEEERGLVIREPPKLDVGEEIEIRSNGLKKKLIKRSIHWTTPLIGYEITVHFVGKLLDGREFVSTRDGGKEPLTCKLGKESIIARGLRQGILSMAKGEIALFTLPPEIAYGELGTSGVPPNSIVQFEVELLSWIEVLDVCWDGGIIKRILEKGEYYIGPPRDLDEVCVKYKALLVDGTVVAETPEEGVEFYVKDGHFCPALPKALKTMRSGERVHLVVQPKYAFGAGEKSNNELPSIPSDSVLNIFMELLSFKRVVDITGDLKVKTKVLKEGEGNVIAAEGAIVTIRYTATLEDGTVFERKGYDGEQPLQFTTDEEQVIDGLDRAVCRMKKNERAIITISPEYGFGSTEVKESPPLVQPSSTVLYEVEMLDFIQAKSLGKMTAAERIEAASRKKEKGNQFLKNEKYQKAAREYEKAVGYLTYAGPYTSNANEEEIVESLLVSCWLKNAACCLKLNKFNEAYGLCSKILEVESRNVKALYTRAQAYIGVGALRAAELDINKALEADPLNREVKLLQENLNQLREESN